MERQENCGYKKRNKLSDEKSVRALFLIAWITYFSTYMGRLNFTAVMNGMIADDGFQKSDMGLVAAAFFFAYGAGQLVSGMLGDRLPPLRLVFFGILTSGFINLAFGFTSDAHIMTALWLLNGLAQSFTWSPMVRLFSERLRGEQCVRVCLGMSTTGPAGMLGAYGAGALAISLGNWRASFFGAFLFMAGVAFVWLFGVRRLERRADKTDEEDEPSPDPSGDAAQTQWTLGRVTVCSGLVFIGAGCCLHGVLKDGVTTWVPTYLTESFHAGAGFSVALTMVLPIVNLAGVFLADRWTHRVFHNEMTVSAVFFAITAAAVLGMGLPFAGLAVSLVLFAVVTSAMAGVNTVFISLMPLHFKRTGRVSTVTGLLNSITYIGSGLASYGFGDLAGRFGWGVTRMFWCAVALAGVAFCVFGFRKWTRFRDSGL